MLSERSQQACEKVAAQLDAVKMLDWFSKREPDSFVGQGNQACSCPIAYYLSHQLEFERIAVYTTCISFVLSEDKASIYQQPGGPNQDKPFDSVPLPPELQRFRALVDTTFITVDVPVKGAIDLLIKALGEHLANLVMSGEVSAMQSLTDRLQHAQAQDR